MLLLKTEFRSFLQGRKAIAEKLFIFSVAAGGKRFFLVPLALAGFAWFLASVLAAAQFLGWLLSHLLGRLFFLLPFPLRLLAVTSSFAACSYASLEQRWWGIAIYLAYLTFNVIVAATPSTRGRESRFLIGPPLGLLYAVSLGLLSSHWIRAVSMLAVTWSFSGKVVDGLASAEAEAKQRRRERIARGVLTRVRAGGVIPPFALYLRPFWITDRMKPVDDATARAVADGTAATVEYEPGTGKWLRTSVPLFEVYAGMKVGQAAFEVNEDVESALERSFSFAGPLVALGAPGEAIGAARLVAAEEWWDDLERLAAAATIFIVVPSQNPGTSREIRWLVEHGHVDKCWFIMPPRTLVIDYSKAWQAAAHELSGVLDLPPYDPGGMVFVHSKEGRSAALPFENGRLPERESLDAFRRSETALRSVDSDAPLLSQDRRAL